MKKLIVATLGLFMVVARMAAADTVDFSDNTVPDFGG